MKSAFVKEVLRSIRGSLSRFMALVLIVALGAGFYAGLRMTAPDMQGAADAFFDGTQLYDIRVLSSFGLTDDDVEALEALDGVEVVMPAHEADMVTLIGGSQYTVRIHSLDIDAAHTSDTEDRIHALSNNPSYLNRPILVEGRWPERAGECVVSADRITDDPVQIGETVQPVEGTRDPSEVFESEVFTVVGTVSSSYYPSSSSLGMTSLGSGYIQQYLYVPQEDFASNSVYTELFVLASGTQELPALSSEYRDKVQEVKECLEDISREREDVRYEEIVQEAEDEYEESYVEYQEERQRVESELEDARVQLEEAAETIASSEHEIEQGRIDYENGIAMLAAQRSETEETLARNYRTLVETATRLDEGEAALKEKEPELAAGWDVWQEGADELALRYEQLKLLDPDSPEYTGLAAALAQQQTALDAAKAELDEKQSTFDMKTQEIATGRTQLSAGWTAYHQGKSEAELRLASAQAELDAADVRLTEARTALEEGKGEYEKNAAEYEENKAEAEEEFAQAEQEFADAREEIESIEKPQWYILDRTKNTGIESFRSDSIRIDQIAQVFPLLFFLVAALVALTTMTRMVDEERMLIGTYKALGYSRAKITSKYIFYVLAASAIGSVVGIAVLSQVLPRVIINAYGIMYTVPQGSLPIDGGIAVLSAGFGIGVTLIATAGAAVATLHEKPALLMLPRAPKPGKRIVLERIKPLWKRVSFSWKVTFRNIFRYKRRFFMTIIGIAGCTALLLTGLGLSNAINDIIPKQFSEIYHYNAIIGLDKDISSDQREEIESEIKKLNGITSVTNAYESIFASIGTEGKQRIVYAIVPQEPEVFSDYISIRTRETQEPLLLSGHEIIVCEKLATELGKKPGDTITFSLLSQQS